MAFEIDINNDTGEHMTATHVEPIESGTLIRRMV